MKLKRVLLFTEGVWPYVMGGMEKHTYYLCKYFAINQVEVIFVHSNPSDLDAGLLEKFSPEEKRFLNSILIAPIKTRPFPGHYLYETYQYSKRAYQAVKHLVPSCDFIIAVGLGGWYYLNNVRKTVPVAVHFHGYNFLQKQLVFYTRLQCLMLRYPFMSQHQHANYIFSLGGRITELLANNGVPAGKIISIPNAIEEQWIRKTDIQNFNPSRFVFIGRYSEVKGIDILDQALNKLLPVHPFEMHFIGPIPEDKQVRSSSVIYHGAIHNEEQIQEILYNCDVLVSPSYTEGMPTVILEAMAAGCAIIATDVGAVPEIVDAEIGWLIPCGNVTALYDAMEQAIKSSNSNLAVLKSAALEKVRAYTWQNVIEKTIEEIENRIK